MFDGTMHTFGDVRFVPSVRKNFILIDQLYSKCCRLFVKGGVMKKCRSVMVIMKAQKMNNQFRLIGIREYGCGVKSFKDSRTRAKMKAIDEVSKIRGLVQFIRSQWFVYRW